MEAPVRAARTLQHMTLSAIKMKVCRQDRMEAVTGDMILTTKVMTGDMVDMMKVMENTEVMVYMMGVMEDTKEVMADMMGVMGDTTEDTKKSIMSLRCIITTSTLLKLTTRMLPSTCQK